MNPHLLASLIYLLLGTGSVALIASLLPLPESKRLVSPFWAKLFIAFCRIVSAAAAFVLVPLQSTDPYLIRAVWFGPLAYLAWEMTGVVADRQGKVTQTKLAKLEKSIHQVRLLLTMLRELIASKRTTIGSALNSKSTAQHTGLSRIRATLDPPQRLRELLASLASLLIIEGQSGGRADAQSFRVCLYVETDGLMREVSSWDSARQNVAGTQSSTRPELRDRFDLGSTKNPSVIVQSVQERRTIVVSDCGKEETVRRKIKESFYFSDSQKGYLKSLICYPFDIGHDPKKPRWAVLAVDTNVAGHFPIDPSGFLEPCLVEYSKRMELELVYEELLNPTVDRGRRTSSS